MGKPIVIWYLTFADSQFSKFIRKRDPKCRRCWINDSTDCSHFVGRSHSATRFDPKNCIGLCRECHEIWEIEKKGAYEKFMINWLGKKEFEALIARGRRIVDRGDAILACMSLCKERHHSNVASHVWEIGE